MCSSRLVPVIRDGIALRVAIRSNQIPVFAILAREEMTENSQHEHQDHRGLACASSAYQKTGTLRALLQRHLPFFVLQRGIHSFAEPPA